MREDDGDGWPTKAWAWGFNAPSVFLALPLAPGEVDLVRERVGAGEGGEPPSPARAGLRRKHRRLRECRSAQSPCLGSAGVPWDEAASPGNGSETPRGAAGDSRWERGRGWAAAHADLGFTGPEARTMVPTLSKEKGTMVVAAWVRKVNASLNQENESLNNDKFHEA